MPTHDNMHAASARVARAVYRGDPEEEASARRALTTEKLRTAIEREVAKAGPLTPDQIKILSGILSDAGAQPPITRPTLRTRSGGRR